MDGFDDLLAPSRQALEDNPFANPFSTRSGSPDPWSSPFGTQSSDEGFGVTSPTSPYVGPEPFISRVPSEHDNKIQQENTHVTDPLDSAAHAHDEDEDNRPLGTLRSPGFRESVVSHFSETATIRPTEPEHSGVEPLTPSVARSATPETKFSDSISTVIQPTHTKHDSISSSGFASPPLSPSGSKFASPLEQPSTSALDTQFASLSLGSEASGWQSEDTSSWGHTDILPTVQADEDSDDDKPIKQTLKHASQDDTQPTSTQRSSRQDNGLQPVFVITVDDPQKVGDPIRSFTMYTVHTRTTSPLFQKSAFSVLRRYSDFLWLYETLCNNNPGIVVPPVPEKSPFGRFEDQFVRQRRLGLEKCIQKIANHPILGKDPDLRLFLESDSFALDIKHRKSEVPHDRGGLIASIGQTIAGPRFYETDEWFDRQKSYLDGLESQLRGLVKAIELVSRHRAELASAMGEFGQTIGDLSSSDVGKQLSHSLAELADVERKAQELQNTQSEEDISTLMATVDEYARLINSVRGAFSSRIRTYHSWKNAENDLLRTKQNHEKNRSSGRIPHDRLGYSLSQIAEAERRALDAKHEFDHVSKLVKSELARFEQERIEDFKDSLHAFLEGMISRQKEVISGWENYQQLLLKRVGGGGPNALRHD